MRPPRRGGVDVTCLLGQYLDMRLEFVEAEGLHDVLWDQMSMTGIAV